MWFPHQCCMVWGQEEGQSVSVTAKPQRQAPAHCRTQVSCKYNSSMKASLREQRAISRRQCSRRIPLHSSKGSFASEHHPQGHRSPMNNRRGSAKKTRGSVVFTGTQSPLSTANRSASSFYRKFFHLFPEIIACCLYTRHEIGCIIHAIMSSPVSSSNVDFTEEMPEGRKPGHLSNCHSKRYGWNPRLMFVELPRSASFPHCSPSKHVGYSKVSVYNKPRLRLHATTMLPVT